MYGLRLVRVDVIVYFAKLHGSFVLAYHGGAEHFEVLSFSLHKSKPLSRPTYARSYIYIFEFFEV